MFCERARDRSEVRVDMFQVPHEINATNKPESIINGRQQTFRKEMFLLLMRGCKLKQTENTFTAVNLDIKSFMQQLLSETSTFLILKVNEIYF